MKLWGMIKKSNRTVQDIVYECARPETEQDWANAIGVICAKLDLARPVLLNKHLNELHSFSRTVFRQEDFMEPIAFSRFELEIIPEKKKTAQFVPPYGI